MNVNMLFYTAGPFDGVVCKLTDLETGATATASGESKIAARLKAEAKLLELIRKRPTPVIGEDI